MAKGSYAQLPPQTRFDDRQGRPRVPDPLICEQCHETLSIVNVGNERAGLSAADVARQWPRLAHEVSVHDALCLGQE